MFKLSFIILAFLMSASAFAIEEKTYSETVDCGSVSQLELFRRVRLAITQIGPDNKILLADKETGDFASQGPVNITLPRSEGSPGGYYQFLYVLSVECVNRKYRATISHVEYLDHGKFVPAERLELSSQSDVQKVKADLDTKMQKVLADLQQNVKDYKPF
ncbi:DUF4468 domain-containing protein [Dyadobacter luticola]|uniref:DUF4468 domain-containing protein n=1 Tax=Dyadobacter luticola TaxID=1979387 RepID=A0A5R9L476_9BACT|nr:DUF4468 domain-containing protein [Dyadobacter luticola]TLV03211.1 DUF4468 domain-containing protein [Dyadobacter luticola]